MKNEQYTFFVAKVYYSLTIQILANYIYFVYIKFSQKQIVILEKCKI